MSSESRIRILTDVDEPRVAEFWRAQTELWPKTRNDRRVLHNLVQAWRILRRRRRYDVMVFDSEMLGNMVALLSAFLPDRTPIVMIDCLWYEPRGCFRLWLKRLQFRLQAVAVKKFVVWASHEVRDYARMFRLPEEKFEYIPFHHTLEGFDYEVADGDYIFSGGDGNRDYRCLIEAVRGLNAKVHIATRLENWNEGAEIPAGVVARGATPEEFRKLMAGSKMVVLPMKGGFLHSGGQQTFLNAMALGKVVIVADDKGAKDYIQHGVNGLIVPSGDSEALRRELVNVFSNPGYARKLAQNAAKACEEYSTCRCMQRILDLAYEVAGRRPGVGGQRP